MWRRKCFGVKRSSLVTRRKEGTLAIDDQYAFQHPNPRDIYFSSGWGEESLLGYTGMEPGASIGWPRAYSSVSEINYRFGTYISSVYILWGF